MSVTDVQSGVFGLTWGHTRTYSNQLQAQGQPTSTDFGNGYNWLTETTAYLLNPNGDESEIQVVIAPQESFWFNLVDGDYVGAYGAVQTLEHDTTNNVFRFVQADGSIWVFFDFDQRANPAGMLSSIIAPGSQSLSFSYPNATSLVSEIQSSYTDPSGVTTVESFLYSYLPSNDENSGEVVSVTLRRSVGGVGWDFIRQALFTYYESGSAFGAVGDLQTAVHQLRSGAGDWDTIETYYYRYWLDSAGGVGFAHGMKYVLGPEAFRRLSAAVLNPLSVTDSQVAQFADFYFEYDGQQRVTLETVEAGSRTFTFAYTPSGNAQDYNYWQTKTVEMLPGSTPGTPYQNTVYTNHIGQILLKDKLSGTTHWIEYFEYDETLAQVILNATPSAVTATYNDSLPNFGGPTAIVNPSSGLVRLTAYYESTTATSTTAGGAQGYIQNQGVQEGLNGSPILLTSLTYIQRNTTDGGVSVPLATIYPVAAATVYQSDSGGGSQPAVTSYTYNYWYTGTLQAKQKTTTLAVVSTAQNGSGVADIQIEYYDSFGNMTWEQGPRGFIDNFTYDYVTGARTQMIEDVDPSQLTLPSGWTRPSGLPTPLNLVTDYEIDDLGRTTQSLGPVHAVNGVNARTATWNVYLDALHQNWTAQGFATGTESYSYTLVNPVSLNFLDNTGRVTDAVKAARATSDGPLSPSDSFPQSSWVAWTESNYDNGGRLTAKRAYSSIPATGVGSPGANYDETDYGYDIMDRQNRAVTPGGTITRTVFDGESRPIAVYVGTNDYSASDSDPTGSGAPGNNMVPVTTRTYEAGCDCTQPTTITQYVDSSTARVTTYTLDFRNRVATITDALAYVSDPLGTVQTNTFDNLDRVIQVQRASSATSTLIAQNQTFFDARGRIYQTTDYAVSGGTVGNTLTDNSWYDAAGNKIKSLPAGAQLFTKTFYDSQARVYGAYQGYYTGSGTEPYSEVGQITSSNVIFGQALTTYDAGGNAVEVDSYQRFDNAIGNGVLNPSYSGTQPLARVGYVASYFDGIGRLTAAANYGTNGNVAFTRPGAAPISSAGVLVTDYSYDDAGNQNQVTDPAGVVAFQTFNALGKVTSKVSNYTGGTPGNDTDVTVQFTYNSDGKLVALTACNPATGNQTTQFIYGCTLADSAIASNNPLVAMIYPDSMAGSGQVIQTYNRQGRVASKTDQNGVVHAYSYDLLGRQIADVVTIPLGSPVDTAIQQITRTYEIHGLVATMSSLDASGNVVNQIQYAYNGFQQLLSESQEHGGAVSSSTPSVDYTYAPGTANTIRATSINYPSGRMISFNYASGDDNALSRVTSISDVAEGTTLVTYTYLGLGTFVDTVYSEPQVTWSLAGGSGANPYLGLDQFGRVINNAWASSSANLDVLQYGYDLVSNRLWRHQSVATGNDELYAYDSLPRLVDMSRGDLTSENQSITNLSLAQKWGLDATGNWSDFVNTDVTTPANNLDQQRTANLANEISGITQRYGSAWAQPAYDPAGEMTTIPQPATPTASFAGTYDAWNRLTTLAGIASYAYDGLNRRITKTIGGSVRDFYYSSEWQDLEERVGGSTSPDRQFIWGLRYIDDLVLRDRPSERLYAVQDANWNVTAVTDTSGNVQERYSYTAYGVPTVLNPDFTVRSSGTSYGWETLYAGYRSDNESGLYQVRNRYLNSTLGVWATRDLVGCGTQEIDPYRYANNNPTNAYDPTGECVPLIIIGVIILIGAGGCSRRAGPQPLPPGVTPVSCMTARFSKGMGGPALGCTAASDGQQCNAADASMTCQFVGNSCQCM